MKRYPEGFDPISIHALREEGDFIPNGGFSPTKEISIHALREEGDPCGWTSTPTHSYFYPRPPRGGRLVRRFPILQSSKFLSTPSARRATISRLPPGKRPKISIHALREEGDLALDLGAQVVEISIHALREEGDVR